ncbi:hypothetical protein B0A48_03570 [Cryoendolithus antarcticus]|uniref:Uncharacterized protein n=1 Tax=Cryoendolithus antarcticus TaxID=1507870 RepID=A0A1V8TKD7_9PEZI|nr:hypothetical protein B0A48_03570 [Cryoendolithus antarcticus]
MHSFIVGETRTSTTTIRTSALIPFLNEVVRARATLARNLEGDDAPDARLLRAARAYADVLAAKLKVLDRNRNKLAGDRASPRKPTVGALVELGKVGLRLVGATLADLAGVDALLGPDGPAAALEEEEESEEE